MSKSLKIDRQRLISKIEELGKIGALEGGGVCRLALTDEDKAGRDWVIARMKSLGLTVRIDQIGNVTGTRAGKSDEAPVMMGSHIDTVRTGGYYDGNLGVLAGLEVIACLNDAGIVTQRPVAVAFFTNEEGSRFAPDMMGSMVHQGHLDLETTLNVVGIDGSLVREELERIAYRGEDPCGGMRAHAFLELHVEQGPILEKEGIEIGAVEGVQGISWTEVRISGVSNHAGTTPMSMRHDAGYCAAKIAVFARELALRMGGNQVATVGAIDLKPNLINVIPNHAVMTVDLRNTDEALLQEAEAELHHFLQKLTADEQVSIESTTLARFEPVVFDPEMVALVEAEAKAQGLTVKRLPSGAGHDAQAFAPNCPTGMIFVQSAGGISHNVKEYTKPEDIEAGANVLLQVLLKKADSED
ncbi:MAG: Zn-dependent hydrolase [SAR324 cluster bacterium]|nr:Zn-dependent hydrolase [SAR324 cluster bacterium]